MVEPSLTTILALTAVAFIAGCVDAIGGGGGLITVPALLNAGLPVPVHVLFGTNKASSVFGTGSALVRFWRAGLISKALVARLAICGFIGSLLGAFVLTKVSNQALKPIVLVLLVIAGFVVAMVRPKEKEEGALPVNAMARATLIALCIGAYDGFFGPGTGTFLIVAMVSLLHFRIGQASANAKVVNFASNLAAVVLFTVKGSVLWSISIPMAVGQFAGGTVGAHLAIQGGDRLVKRVVFVVVIGLVAKLSFDLL